MQIITVASTCAVLLSSGSHGQELDVRLPREGLVRTSNDTRPTVCGGHETSSDGAIDRPRWGDLKAHVLYHVSRYPGSDSEDVSEALGLSPVDASDALRELLREGLIGFAD
jgi:hypothetical protein